MSWLRAVSARIVIPVVAAVVDRFLAMRSALYGRWFDRRSARRRRHLRRPLDVRVLRQVVMSVALKSLLRVFEQLQERSREEHLSDPVRLRRR